MTTVKAIIEIPANTNYKYEVDKDTGLLTLDRVLSINVPFNYGYLPGTLCGDGDPLDIFVISSSQIFPLTTVYAEVVGVYRCIDNGDQDDKLIAVLPGEDLDQETLEAAKRFIEFYLTNYKTGFQIVSYHDALEAVEVLGASIDSHKAGEQ